MGQRQPTVLFIVWLPFVYSALYRTSNWFKSLIYSGIKAYGHHVTVQPQPLSDWLPDRAIRTDVNTIFPLLHNNQQDSMRIQH